MACRTVLVLAGALAFRCGGPPERPDILLVTLDTTRYDRFGSYGYERNTTPNLDRLAERSLRYEVAIASSSWTLPSHATLFTGKLTTSHGASYDPEGPLRLADAIAGPASFDQYRARGLALDETTLAELLSDAGYRTGAIVGGPWMRRAFGLDRGFSHYDDDAIGTVNGRRASDVTRAALAWLDEGEGEPFFLFLNYYDAHAPYDPPEPFRSEFAPGAEPSAADLYDGEIAYMDSHVGRVLDALDLDRTLVIVTSDHGELFGEHDRVGHGNSLYQEEIRVPLLVHAPGGTAGGDADEAGHLARLMPLMLDHAGVPVPSSVDTALPLISEVYPLPFSSKSGSWQALIAGEYKLLKNDLGDDRLYHLTADPAEAKNLIKDEPDRAEAMTRFLEAYLASLPPPGDAGPPAAIDAETRDALKALGYVR